MKHKKSLSIFLVVIYFVMGVATSRMPRDVAYQNRNSSPIRVMDTKHIIFFESFNDNKNAWPEGRFSNAEYYFDKGKYVISNKDSSTAITQEVLTNKRILEKDDWIIELSLSHLALQEGSRLSLLWGKKGEDYISYSYRKKGSLAVLDYGKNTEGAWVGATKSVNDFVGRFNNLKLTAFKTGGSIKYFLNNKYLFSGPVEKFFGDKMAVAVEGVGEAYIDEIVVKQLQFRSNDKTYSTNRSAKDYSMENMNVIPLRKMGEHFLIPLQINNSMSTYFIYDPWAAEVVVSEAQAKELINQKLIKEYIDNIEYTFEDGSKSTSARFIIDELKIGEKNVRNVECLILPSATNNIQIGKTVLKRIGDFRIDSVRKILVFEN